MNWAIKKEHHGMIIRDFLQKNHGFSRRMLTTLKKDKRILVNGAPQTVRFCLSEGDYLEVIFPRETIGENMVREKMELAIVYEDDAVIVLNKPAGIATIPSQNHPTGTIANGVLAYYEENNIPHTIHVVTRLDRDTSGLLLIAKDRYSHSLLATTQKQRAIKRKYQAIVKGHLEPMSGTIDASIDRKEGSIIERAVIETGKRAITHYKVIKEYADTSLVEIELETGRTHQIRVHFSHINHSLLGDDLYGGSIERIERQALHCIEISFEHPFTKEIISLKSSLSEDMLDLIRELEDEDQIN
ncbi:RluA family pseudouridine synthase [Oceanobacillus chungangensis]|uniref:Pseudouridine synthase n=1 Tax=Oceanobacillus chungangensis TaxID=1229152 RepID=A0A3D8PKG6_9BACI|nr:RluA family pseudouridine synthase [Oceanobacillus chungangensis]RDW15977.1 RNA pseudouridine synthase [Oceanobacillus chungangensis]